MSTFRTPVGPQPSRVYWRRRLVVGLGLLAVIVIVVLIIVRPGSAGPGVLTSASPSPTSASANPAGVGACDPAKVTLTATTDASNYAAGVKPVLSFTLTSLMTGACSIQAGSDVQEFRVTSGSELIWTSKDCQTAPVAATAILQQGVPKQGPTVTWDRTRSSPTTCSVSRSPVIAQGASYHLQVVVGGLTSTPATNPQFLLN